MWSYRHGWPTRTQSNGHSLTAYGPTNTGQLGSQAFAGNVGNSANQMTILIADTSYATGFPSGPAPNLTMSTLNLDPAGGAVCWEDLGLRFLGELLRVAHASPAGTPAVAMSGGQALRRSIAAGCSTLLESSDDTNQSSADFSLQTPNPRANSSTIVETNCVAPQTTINTGPAKPTMEQSASFTFSANPSAGATFECKLDSDPYASCTSPKNYTGPLDGDNTVTGTSHTFLVRATNATGTDPTPAEYVWNVDRVAPTITINNQPANPSTGASASFTYSADEALTGTPTTSFQCSLAKGAAADSFSNLLVRGENLHGLPDDNYTFKVHATDKAGNPGADDTYTWEVDNSLADTTPPETTILTKPVNPSVSGDASFTYASNEPGSTFECKLDGAAFEGCLASGKSYYGAGEAARTPSRSGRSTRLPTSIPAPPATAGKYPLRSSLRRRSRRLHHLRLRFRTRPSPPSRRRRPATAPRPSASVRASRAPATRAKSTKAPSRSCSSPFTTKTLTFGPHSLQVRAVAGGAVDPTPAKSNFKVLKPKKKKKK